MALGQAHTRTTMGIDALPVLVEAHISGGLPKFKIVGLSTANENKERVRSAIINCGFKFPSGRITVSLSPADTPKEGGSFDLAIAISILAATKQIACEQLNKFEFAAELGLSGELKPIPIILPHALAIWRAKNISCSEEKTHPQENINPATKLIVANENLYAASLCDPKNICSYEHLLQITNYFSKNKTRTNNNHEDKYTPKPDKNNNITSKTPGAENKKENLSEQNNHREINFEIQKKIKIRADADTDTDTDTDPDAGTGTVTGTGAGTVASSNTNTNTDQHAALNSTTSPSQNLQTENINNPNQNLQAENINNPNQNLQAENINNPNQNLQAENINNPNQNLQTENINNPNNKNNNETDLQDIVGQTLAKRALIIAAAGGHSLLFVGAPGVGKTMLASCLSSLLPPISREDALEVACVYACSIHGFQAKTWRKRPFRSPHHTCSHQALVGGSRPPQPGEISLAHKGILFLDELPEFSRSSLEALREPLEAKAITISRAAIQIQYPADFQLIAAMNPCPCGYAGSRSRPCRCTTNNIQRYLLKLSGPLLDRIDMKITMAEPTFAQLITSRASKQKLNQNSGQQELSSSAAKTKIYSCQQLQHNRQQRLNSQLGADSHQNHLSLGIEQQKFLQNAVRHTPFSNRHGHRLLTVARTIADLESSPNILNNHLSESLNISSSLSATSELSS